MRALMIGALALALAIGAAGAAGAQQPVVWKKYVNPAFGITVRTPAPPQLTQSQMPTQGVGPASVLEGSVVVDDNSMLMFSVTDYAPTGLSFDENRVLEFAVQGALDKAHATLDSKQTIKVNGYPGREIVVHSPDGVVRARIVWRGKRLYSLLSIGSTAGGVPAWCQQFEDSLVMTD